MGCDRLLSLSGVAAKGRTRLLGDRPTVGLQILDLAILVRIQVSQPILLNKPNNASSLLSGMIER